MKVKIEYHDQDSLTVEEVVRQAKLNYGSSVKVEVAPESSIAYDHIYFGLQQLITFKQASIFHDTKGAYQADLAKLRSDVLYKIGELVDQVIIDNENRLS